MQAESTGRTTQTANGTMSPEDAEEFSQSFGQIGSGWWRQVAWAQRQGIPAALGLGTDEWVEKYVGGHVRMSIPDRREAVAELTEEGMSTREIGDVLGVGKSTVADDRAVQDRTPEPEEPASEAEADEVAVQDRTPEPIPGQTTLPVRDEADEQRLQAIIEEGASIDARPAPEEAELRTSAEDFELAVQRESPAPVAPTRRASESKRWERALDEANDAAKTLRGLPPFPGDDQLLVVAAREIARLLVDAAAHIIDELPAEKEPLRRIK
jgi:hypothetical protein